MSKSFVCDRMPSAGLVFSVSIAGSHILRPPLKASTVKPLGGLVSFSRGASLRLLSSLLMSSFTTPNDVTSFPESLHHPESPPYRAPSSLFSSLFSSPALPFPSFPLPITKPFPDSPIYLPFQNLQNPGILESRRLSFMWRNPILES